MTSLTFILSQDENEWQTTSEQKKESIPITTLAINQPSLQNVDDKVIPPTSFNYMNIIKEKKINQCTFCPKKFTKPSALKAHLYSHTGEKPNSCPYADCRRHFSLLSNLRRHIKIHTQAGMKRRQQQQHQQQHRNNYNDPSATNKRRVPPLLPSPYTPSIKICSSASPIQYRQQPLPYTYHSSIQIQASMAKK